ncbi:unnamed protein product [Tilletia caries]|nr:unnamed protein product [Tilletia caries]
MESFESATAQTLREISRHCDFLIQTFSATRRPSTPPTLDRPFADINLRDYISVKCSECSEALRRLRLSQYTSTELFGIYVHSVETFAAKASQMALAAYVPAGSSGTTSEIVGALEAFMQRKCDSFQELLLATVQEGLEVAVSNSPAEDDDGDDPDDGTSSDDEEAAGAGDAQRYTPQTVAILERVFERTSSITHAEKNRIANAIGLTPRQVTVWFCNRRYRHSPSDSAPTPATKFESSKKRELDPHQAGDDTEEDVKSDGENVEELLLTTIQGGKKRLELDVSESAGEEEDDSDDDQDSGSFSSEDGAAETADARERPSDVVALLDRALERNMNITQAEMNHIAKLINLTPQQVTVWFQKCRDQLKLSDGALTPAMQPESSKGRGLASQH